MLALKEKHSQILSLIRGRVRIHLPAWTGPGASEASSPPSGAIEDALRQLPGIQTVEANPITQNVLIHYDAQLIDPETILFCLQPFGSLQEEADEDLDGWQLVERLRMLAAMGKLISYFGGGTRLRGAASGLAVESALLLVSLVGDAVGLPVAGLGRLHLIVDLLLFGAFFHGPRPTVPVAVA